MIKFLAQSWQTLQFPSKPIAAKGVLGYDFSTSASQIRWTVSASSASDFYLVDPTNFQLLKAGSPFSYEWRLLGSTLGSGGYSNVAKISQRLIICVKNLQDTQITASYTLEQYIPGASSSLGGLLWLVIVGSIVGFYCLCYCLMFLIGLLRTCCCPGGRYYSRYYGYNDPYYVGGPNVVVVGDGGYTPVVVAGDSGFSGGYSGDSGGDSGFSGDSGGNSYD